MTFRFISLTTQTSNRSHLKRPLFWTPGPTVCEKLPQTKTQTKQDY
jgi:hypothetical protein